MPIEAIVLLLGLLFSMARIDGARPDPEPETLWAAIVSEETTYDDRMHAAERAGRVLPLHYIPILAATQEEVNTRAPWQLLADNETADRRKLPWEGQMRDAFQRIRIDTSMEDPVGVLRHVPCTNDREERVMLHAIGRFPASPETFGIMRNIALRRAERDPVRERGLWYHDGRLAPDHGQWALQAFIAELAPSADPELLQILSHQTASLRGGKTPPYTAFLAVAERLDALALNSANRDQAAENAALVMQAMGRYPSSLDGLSEMRRWLAEHREELRKGAAAERVAIETARARMVAVTLCR